MCVCTLVIMIWSDFAVIVVSTINTCVQVCLLWSTYFTSLYCVCGMPKHTQIWCAKQGPPYRFSQISKNTGLNYMYSLGHRGEGLGKLEWLDCCVLCVCMVCHVLSMYTDVFQSFVTKHFQLCLCLHVKNLYHGWLCLVISI